MNAARPLFFIALGLFGLYAVEFGVVGILPLIVDRFGITVARAGWLVALFALIVAVCGPFMVLWLSRFDRRRVLAGSLFVFAACSALSAWAADFVTLMLLRIVPALLHPVFFAQAFAAAVALYPPSRATHAPTMAFVGTSMGLVLGTACGRDRYALFLGGVVPVLCAGQRRGGRGPAADAAGRGAGEPIRRRAVIGGPAQTRAVAQHPVHRAGVCDDVFRLQLCGGIPGPRDRSGR